MMDTLLHDNIHKDIGNSRAVRQDEVDELRARIAALESQLAELNRILDLHITSGQQLLLKRLAAESQLAASEAKCAEHEAGRKRALLMADEAVTKAETFEWERDQEHAARAEAERELRELRVVGAEPDDSIVGSFGAAAGGGEGR